MELRVFWTGKEYQSVREGFTKKVALLLDFVQMGGGRALPKFFVTFS